MTIVEYIKEHQQELLDIAPPGYSINKLCNGIRNGLATNPKLAQCDSADILDACKVPAAGGLYPNTDDKHGGFSVFWNKGKYKVQFISQYNGRLLQAKQSGEVLDAVTRIIYANERYKITFGTDEKIQHEPLFRDRGEPIAAYCVLTLKDGIKHTEVMSIDEIYEIRDRRKDDNNKPIVGFAWRTDLGEMIKKTPLNRALKMVTKDPLPQEDEDLGEAYEFESAPQPESEEPPLNVDNLISDAIAVLNIAKTQDEIDQARDMVTPHWSKLNKDQREKLQASKKAALERVSNEQPVE